jgi:hypothetical protein
MSVWGSNSPSLLREVDVRLHRRQQAQQLVAERVYLLRESALVQGERAAQLRLRAGAD